jgi:phosphoribosylamine-glycine ligase
MAIFATAQSLKEAVKLACKGLESVKLQGMYYRSDIAYR